MNFTLLPSLEHIALVQIVHTFWNQDDVRGKIIQYIQYCLGDNLEDKGRDKEWSEIEFIIIGKVSQLPMPESLRKGIMGYIIPVGRFIRKWIQAIHSLFLLSFGVRGDIRVILPNSFCWTSQGTIDQRKTAEVLIKDERLAFTTRYTLACYFCFDADIPMLRDKIPEYVRMDFYDSDEEQSDEDVNDSLLLWTSDFALDLVDEPLDIWFSPCQRAFECAALRGNKAATEYFLQKLTHDEREESLTEIARTIVKADDLPSPFLCEIFCFLLSKMNEQQQLEVIKNAPYALCYLLEWPWQSLFLETAYRIRNVVDIYDNDANAMQRLLFKQKINFTDCNYRMLFEEFWKQIPIACKNIILNEELYIFAVLEELLLNEDRRNIELIFKNATPLQKENFAPDTVFIYRFLKNVNDWDFLKFVIEEFVYEELAIEFLEVLNELAIKKGFKNREDLCDKLSQLLNGLVHEVDGKRSMEEASDNPPKKLCSIVTKKLLI